MRKLNTELLQGYAIKHGKLWREKLAVESKIPYVKITRLIRGDRTASEVEMDSLGRHLGENVDDLFPVVEHKKEIIAS